MTVTVAVTVSVTVTVTVTSPVCPTVEAGEGLAAVLRDGAEVMRAEATDVSDGSALTTWPGRVEGSAADAADDRLLSAALAALAALEALLVEDASARRAAFWTFWAF